MIPNWANLILLAYGLFSFVRAIEMVEMVFRKKSTHHKSFFLLKWIILVNNRSYARKMKLAEFDIKKSGLKSYLENLKGIPGNPGV